MQILWREVFDGNRPLTVDEFLYCHKPSEISQSLVFYQFFARSSNCRLVRSLPTFDRRWKTKFFFVSRFWAGNPIEVGKDPFPPYIGEMGNLCLDGMLPFTTLFFYFIFYFFCTTVRRPSLNKFYLDHVQQACSFPNRTFHSLSSHQLKRHLLTCSLCVNMSYLNCKILIVYFVQILTPFFFVGMATMKENKGKGLADQEVIQEEVCSQPRPSCVEKRKTLSKTIDMDSLPSCRGHKKAKHGLSKFKVIKAGSFVPPAPAKQPSMQILDKEPSNPEVTPSKPPSGSLMTLLSSESLSWERFQQGVSEKDVAIGYDMSVKEFKQSTVHDLFKVLFLVLNYSPIKLFSSIYLTFISLYRL